METLKLQKRDLVGKKVKRLREENLIPAVVYNSKKESTNVSIDASDADWLFRNTTSTTILETELGKEKYKTLVKGFDINPVTEDIQHVSLFQIDESAPMLFSIPFNFIGVSPAVKNNLGVLVKVMDSIEVRCKLADLQSAIDIDLTTLKDIGDTVNMLDIELPKGMEIINKELENATIVTITEAQKIEEVVTTTEEEGEEGEEIEGEEGETVEGEGSEEGETETPETEKK
jgi:large subunit ribosomal protein L25